MNLVYLFSFNPIVVLFVVESALKLRMLCLHEQVFNHGNSESTIFVTHRKTWQLNVVDKPARFHPNNGTRSWVL